MKNSKSLILQIIGIIIILLGSYMLYQHLRTENTDSSILGGLGAITTGIAVLITSKSKAVSK